MKKLFSSIVFAASVLTVTSAFAWGDNGYFSNSSSNEPYNRSGGDYSRNETLRGGDVVDATVLMVREVVQESTDASSAIGTAAGGAIGGLAGSKIGKGNGRYVTGILGAIAGAAIGQTAGRYASERMAGEVLVQLANGPKKFIVQEDGMQFRPGQKVFVYAANSTSNSYFSGGQSQNLRIVANTTAAK